MRGLLRLLVTFLRPYKGPVALVVILVLAQSIANLYLPNLNADIINNGVVKGDIGYIWRIGGLMLALACISPREPRWVWAAMCGGPSSNGCRSFPRAR